MGAVATSPDGLTWTPNLPGTFDYFASVAFGGGTFVAGGGGVISTSPDGVHWEPRSYSQTGVGVNVELHRIRYLGGIFVAIGVEYLIGGYIAGVLYTSPNGIQWTQSPAVAIAPRLADYSACHSWV